MESEEKKSFFELLDSKSALLVGLVGGLLTIGTIGFLVLGIAVLKGSVQIGGGTATTKQDLANQADSTDQGTETAPAVVDVGVGHYPAKGNANAPLTIVEFADFRCPFCERFYNDAEKGIINDYVNTGKAKLYFRSYAFLGPASTDAHMAGECANEQGKFWQFHDWMYNNQAPENDTEYYSKANLIKYAANLGLNRSSFATCLNSDKYAAQIQQDLQDGQQAGVQGTPTIFINGHALVGAQPYSAVKSAIEQVLAGQ